ncbi:methyltransferase domain-containing protein [Streptomyces alkaliterrae]|uniref:Arsenite methyltransferase n=1 Tax=Streptomyces alkaliterrae TaxID=2213162 RepID=A0A5P0YLQ7_9ACTN|nr:methyltransferase domain-containing protein [Streptomyces alkaliterrae]MBB1257814.1 methyltransferase domain-containing protein [Streptomyces alkaliterrae]MQS01191.1 methyltransferase domain-containing protein [Streptomyces alkaliterrae]
MTTVDTDVLEARVKDLYRLVAQEPEAAYHFEMGRSLAERLGYPGDLLDRVPAEAVESFAGVGYFLDLAEPRPGERVVDLGSGSGMDSFCAALLTAPAGRVLGVDMTAEQLDKARRLAGREAGGALGGVEFAEGRIEDLPAEDGTFDCAISNGVINLSPLKQRVFDEVARVLRPGGRLALADIVSEQQLTEAITCDADLWASCIGGAAQRNDYRHMIERAGLEVVTTRRNPYVFLSPRARDASARYGVTSISLLAVKPGGRAAGSRAKPQTGEPS